MGYQQFKFVIATPGRGLINITDTIEQKVQKANITIGLCHIFLHHTSASLTLCENDDPLVLHDLERFMQQLAPDSSSAYKHCAEGPDDMPSHIRTILTQSFLTLPITDHKLALGRWQGIYLWEHRLAAHHREITVTLSG
jgi:secondary thiamine-phosphate synthase enzyme